MNFSKALDLLGPIGNKTTLVVAISDNGEITLYPFYTNEMVEDCDHVFLFEASHIDGHEDMSWAEVMLFKNVSVKRLCIDYHPHSGKPIVFKHAHFPTAKLFNDKSIRDLLSRCQDDPWVASGAHLLGLEIRMIGEKDSMFIDNIEPCQLGMPGIVVKGFKYTPRSFRYYTEDGTEISYSRYMARYYSLIT